MQVHYGRRSRRSGRLLEETLREIEGESINFGYPRDGEINQDDAIRLASNKRRALLAMQEANIPTPRIYEADDTEAIQRFPVVGRPDRHRAGKSLYLCINWTGIQSAIEHGCTHFLEYIEGGREFRVHIAFGRSIKLAEKIGGNPIIKNFSYGSRFMYPQDFNHKKTLRRVAKQAVESLGLDFGAVDIIYKDDKYYVLEVNTAPSLTSNSDILSRYTNAFIQRSEDE